MENGGYQQFLRNLPYFRKSSQNCMKKGLRSNIDFSSTVLVTKSIFTCQHFLFFKLLSTAMDLTCFPDSVDQKQTAQNVQSDPRSAPSTTMSHILTKITPNYDIWESVLIKKVNVIDLVL